MKSEIFKETEIRFKFDREKIKSPQEIIQTINDLCNTIAENLLAKNDERFSEETYKLMGKVDGLRWVLGIEKYYENRLDKK